MTATYAGAADPAVAASPDDVAPATRFRRRAVAASAVVGGLLTAAGFAATNWETAETTSAYLDSLVADPFRSQVAAVLLHFGYFGFVPVLLALGAMTRRRWRVVGDVGLVLGMGGALALPGLLVSDFYDIAIRQALPAEQAVAVSEAAHDSPVAALLGGPLIPALFAAMALLGVAAWRAGFFHWSASLLVVASFAIPMVAPPGAAQGIATGTALALFMIAVGVAAFRMTDREWVTGVRGAGR